MSPDDARILETWARGGAGANLRLARRAWLILQEHHRTPPTTLTQAWGTAAGAQAWVAAYHAIGLVGLMEKPRTGRPAVVRASAARALQALVKSSAEAAGPDELAQLPRNLREAIWRANRLSGGHIERQRRRADLPLPAPPGCHALVAVFASDALIVVASVPKRASQSNSRSAGVWLEAHAAGVSSPAVASSGVHLLGALSLTEKRGTPNKRADQARHPSSSPPALAASKRLLLRLVSALEALAWRHPQQLAVEVVASHESSVLLVEFLKHCRQRQLWTPRNARWPSPLGALAIQYDHDRSQQPVAAAVDRALPGVNPEARRQLSVSLLQPRDEPVAWRGAEQV